jgi:hypothetical protein
MKTNIPGRIRLKNWIMSHLVVDVNAKISACMDCNKNCTPEQIEACERRRVEAEAIDGKG